MAFVKRDDAGAVVAVFEYPTDGALEDLHPEHPDLAAFLTRILQGGDVRDHLALSDREMSRVLEDLVQCLIDKRVIAPADLPGEAIEKINRRKRMRQDIASS